MPHIVPYNSHLYECLFFTDGEITISSLRDIEDLLILYKKLSQTNPTKKFSTKYFL